jgi:hypothetical protein
VWTSALYGPTIPQLELGATMRKVSVLLPDSEEARFSAYCRERGHKKSTLIARLIREHLDSEGYAAQTSLSLNTNEIQGHRPSRDRDDEK